MPTGLGDEQLWISATNDNTGTSTAFNDQSGEGNNGTAVGTLVVADTSEGGSFAFDFDGVNDRIDCPSTVLSGSQVFSMSCWVYVDSHDATYGEGLMGQWEGSVSSNQVGIIYTGPATSFRGIVTAGGSNYSSTASGTSPPTGAWHHLASVVDGSNVTLYVDGISQGATAYSGSINSSPTNAFEIGRYKGSGTASDRHCLDGKMDDIRTYGRALTQAEITHLASQRGIEGPPPVGLGDEQLWLCPSLNDSANDISGNGNDGTYNGGMGTISDVSNGGSRCYDFDGVNDYIDCGNAIAPTTGYSASAWVSSTTFPTTNVVGTIIEKGYDGTDEPFAFGFKNPTDMRSYTYDGTLHGITNHTHGMSTGTWYHVATTFDGADWKLFVNGSEVATVSDSTALTQNSLNTYIGASWQINTVDRFLNAKLDDVRLFYRALTQSEITHLATSRGIEGSPSGPPAQYNAFLTHAFKQLFQTRLR